MIRLILFIALTYCYLLVIGLAMDAPADVEISKIFDYYAEVLHFIGVPLLALLYARSVRWVFTFNPMVSWETRVQQPPVLRDKVVDSPKK